MKKSTILSYLFTVCVMIFCFSAVYYFNYSRMKREMEEQNDGVQQGDGVSVDLDDESQGESEDSSEQLAGIDEYLSESDTFLSVLEPSTESDKTNTENTDDDLREVGVGGEIRTNPSMVFVVGQYDWITGIVTETVKKFPEELLDLTRQELLVYLREHPEYGTLLSFSEHAVYLRKSDEEDWSDYTYYLILEDEGLMVYYLDQTTLYLDTGIQSEELNDEDRKLLEEGFYIKDTAGLFDYLQTVTS